MIIDFAVKFVWNGLIALIIGVSSTIIGNFIPRTWVRCDRFPFKEYRFEKNGKLYDMFGIERWKGKLPDISEYIKSVFPKKVTGDLMKEGYFERFAKETCISELIHFVLICISPLYLLFNWDIHWGIAVMFIDIMVNIPFIMVQRYNRPRLLRIAQRSSKLHNAHIMEKTADGTAD